MKKSLLLLFLGISAYTYSNEQHQRIERNHQQIIERNRIEQEINNLKIQIHSINNRLFGMGYVEQTPLIEDEQKTLAQQQKNLETELYNLLDQRHILNNQIAHLLQ